METTASNVVSEQTFVQVNLDDAALERVMDNEDKRIMPPCKVISGTLTSRLRTLAMEAGNYQLQSEFRDAIIQHPAYPLVVAEIAQACQDHRLSVVFDKIEETGAVVAYDKVTGKVTIGLNPVKMASTIKEHTPMFCVKDKRALDFVNKTGRYAMLGEDKEEHGPVVGMSTTYYMTFQI